MRIEVKKLAGLGPSRPSIVTNTYVAIHDEKQRRKLLSYQSRRLHQCSR